MRTDIQAALRRDGQDALLAVSAFRQTAAATEMALGNVVAIPSTSPILCRQLLLIQDSLIHRAVAMG